MAKADFSCVETRFFPGKIISQRSAFTFCSLARALAACLPCQDHVYSTTDESIRFNNKKFDEMRCKLDSTENPTSFEITNNQPGVGNTSSIGPAASHDS